VDLDRRFRSEKAEYPYPLVIRLVVRRDSPSLEGHVTNAILCPRFATVASTATSTDDLNRKGVPDPRPTKPSSRGGANTWDNVVTACTSKTREEQPPPDGVRYVSQDHAEGAALRRHGVVLAGLTPSIQRRAWRRWAVAICFLTS